MPRSPEAPPAVPAEAPVLHDARITPDQTTHCCGRDPRTVGALTDKPSKVTCGVDLSTEKKEG